MADWKPIGTAPRDGRAIIVFVPSLADSITKGCLMHSLIDADFIERKHNPTHWMPLPEAPSERNTERVFHIYTDFAKGRPTEAKRYHRTAVAATSPEKAIVDYMTNIKHEAYKRIEWVPRFGNKPLRDDYFNVLVKSEGSENFEFPTLMYHVVLE